MIERERLQELIEKEETVWCASELWGGNKLKLHNKDVRDSDCFHISKTLLLSDSIEFYDEEETYRVPFQLLFETQQEYLKHKEDAEWVAKMHTQRTEFFEPKIYENLDEWDTYHFTEPKLKCRGSLSVTPNTIIVVSGYKGYCETHKSFGDRTKDNYIKACEFARNLFLGKERCEGEKFKNIY